MTFKIRFNGDLRGTPRVRVIAANGEMLGVLTLAEALRAAVKAGLDLVEVNPSANPPVCKIMDFGRHKADEKRKAGKAKDDVGEDDPSDE